MLELGDIQGLVFSGYARQRVARYWFLKLPVVGATGWLARLLTRVTTSERGERRNERRVNVAFTLSGLEALGLAEESLRTFPQAFLRGMTAPERSRLFGDEGESAPEHWQFGGTAAGRVDAVVFAYAETVDALDELSDELEDEFERFACASHVEDAYLADDLRDHLGFLDARTSPHVQGGPRKRPKNPYDPSVPAGEFVLGYRNASGHFATSPRAPVRSSLRALPRLVDATRAMDLGHNGTFVVVRKLALDVPGFWDFAGRAGRALWGETAGDASERLAETLVGRRRDGGPLRLPNETGEPDAPFDARAANRFGFRGPSAGVSRCPIGSHIRRANPRDALGENAAESLAAVRKHRLIRRGRLYGPRFDAAAPDTRERGLLFFALCADLERQFEFVHETWLNHPRFGGLTHERDPVAGAAQGASPDTFSIQDVPFRRQVALERFVRVRGGTYLFMPGLRALAYLAEG